MKEIRNHNDNITFRNEAESRHVSGYAVVFDSLSKDLGGFYEVIDKRALDGVIEKSDVLCVLNHNQERGILARSKYGVGTLTLTIDERGLKYDFEAPNPALGDELIEGLKRGDISTSSFAFSVAEDTWEKRNDGSILRTINSINRLFDVSPVFCEAYPETSVDLRSYNNFMEELKKQEIENRSEEEEKEVKETEEKETENETPKEEEKEEKSAEEETEKETSEDNDKEEDKENKSEESEEENKEDKEEERELKNNVPNLYIQKNKTNRNMSKFSLIKTINDVVNNRNLDDTAVNVIKEGRKAANMANVETNGQIVLALEKRADGDAVVTNPNGILATVPEQGKEAIPTDTFEIVGALRDRMVLAEAGAQFMSLQGNVEIPIYSGANCSWDSEVGEAKDGSGKFTSVKLSPKRLTATLPISRQFLIQSSESAEALLRNDLINCIAEKLQKTILGNGAGDNVTPKGMLNGVTADSAVYTYDDAVNMEATLEGANVYGDYKWVVSPNAKAVLRTTSMDKGSGKFIYENNAVLGVDALSTNSVVNKGVILGDWKELIVGCFGALDIVVDPYTAANKAQVILTVNAFFDYVERRPEAFVKRILK